MPPHVEREFKLHIPSEAALQSLLAQLGVQPPAPVLQTNHFFDTAARDLGAARLGLRLREERERFTLTLKGALLDATSTLASRPEEELELPPAVARSILAGRRSPLAALAASPLAGTALVEQAKHLVGPRLLVHLGAFENERLRVGPLALPAGEPGPPLVLEFDRTRFPGGVVDRELEVELPAGARPEAVERALRSLFSAVGLRPDSVNSKAARFFRLLGRQTEGAGGA
jgi:CYTH domain-containing protein